MVGSMDPDRQTTPMKPVKVVHRITSVIHHFTVGFHQVVVDQVSIDVSFCPAVQLLEGLDPPNPEVQIVT
jgi:hypothetical protein